MESVAVDIAGNVDNHIDMDSDSSSDNDLLEEVVRELDAAIRTRGTFGYPLA